jgi:hypothetical protein
VSRKVPVVSKPAGSASAGSTGASGWVVVFRGVPPGESGAAEPGVSGGSLTALAQPSRALGNSGRTSREVPGGTECTMPRARRV